MTQTDGVTPTAQEVRLVLGRARISCEQYTQALTVAATGLAKSPRLYEEYALLSAVSVAHHDLAQHLEAVLESLGLPYEAVIDSTVVC